jgi:hypothetical protein
MSTYQDITLTSGATTVTLPADMEWTDRLSRNLVAQNIERAANGANVVEEFQMQGGYPITLVALGPGDTWVSQAVVKQLQDLADAPQGSPMTLVYNDGTSITVRFAYSGTTPAVEAKPVVRIFPRDDDESYCSLTLRLIQASA